MKKIGFWGFLLFILGMTFFTYYFFVVKDDSVVEARGSYYFHKTSPHRRQVQTVSPTPQVSATPKAPVTPTTPPSPTPLPTIIGTPVPASQSVSFGLVVDDFANKAGTVASVEQALGHKVGVLSIYKQFGLPENKNIDPSEVSYAKTNGKKLLIAWEPWNPDQGMDQSTDYLKSIVSGAQDSYIHSFAQSVKTFAGPVELRFGHEMNGDWYPWSNRPADYKAAYRYINGLFKQDGVTNVKWMWSINAENVPVTPISAVSSFYPGDDVVDVIGIDGFNFATPDVGGWKTFNQIFQPPYAYLTKTYNKPVSISETASTEVGGDKAAWVNSMFLSLPGTYPKVYELVWFNLLKEADWRINSTQQSQQAFKTSLVKLIP